MCDIVVQNVRYLAFCQTRQRFRNVAPRSRTNASARSTTLVQRHTIPSHSTPQSCLLFAGFGNLTGKIDVFGRRTLNKKCTISALNTSYCSWSHQVAGSVINIFVTNLYRLW